MGAYSNNEANRRLTLTDGQIREIFLGVVNHYIDITKEDVTPEDKYHEMYYELYDALYVDSVESKFFLLSNTDKQKVFSILDTYFYAHPDQRKEGGKNRPQATFHKPDKKELDRRITEANVHHHHHFHRSYYNKRLDFFDWYMINASLNNSYRSGYAAGYGGGRSAAAGKTSNNEKNQDLGSLLVYLVLLCIIFMIAILAVVSLYYLLSQTIISLERFAYNEGWMQAMVVLASIPVSFVMSSILATTFATLPIYGLAIAAGITNPLSWVVLAVMGLTAMGTATGCLITNMVQNYWLKDNNALDPMDPNRLTLSGSEVSALEKNGYDVVKVKCAMLAIRAEMGKSSTLGLWERWWSEEGRTANERLGYLRKSIRAMCNGNHVEIETKQGLVFNCKQDGWRPNRYGVDLSHARETAGRGIAPSVYGHHSTFLPTRTGATVDSRHFEERNSSVSNSQFGIFSKDPAVAESIAHPSAPELVDVEPPPPTNPAAQLDFFRR